MNDSTAPASRGYRRPRPASIPRGQRLVRRQHSRRGASRCGSDLVAGGRSNLTFEVSDAAGSRYVLRRPPTSHVLPTAHDMSREYRIISALGPAGVPVPPALGLCTDDSVNGAPFYVMGFVDGVIARSEVEVEAESRPAGPPPGAAWPWSTPWPRSTPSIPDAVGPGRPRPQGGLHRPPAAPVVRQLPGRPASPGAATPLPDVDEVHDQLAARIPEQGRPPSSTATTGWTTASCADDGECWPCSTGSCAPSGDPLADLGQLIVYWPEPGERSALGHVAHRSPPGFPDPGRAARPLRRQPPGRDLAHLDFYVAFGYWKLACILEGVYTRYVGRRHGRRRVRLQRLPRVDRLAGAIARHARP